MRKPFIVPLLAGVASLVAILNYFVAPSMNLFDICGKNTKYSIPLHRVYIEACLDRDGFQLKDSTGQVLSRATFDGINRSWVLKAHMTNGEELQLKLNGNGRYKNTVIFRFCPDNRCKDWQVLFSFPYSPPSHHFTSISTIYWEA